MKTPEVMEALRARHSEDKGWVCLEEAFNIDFLALACHGQYGGRAERRAVGALHPWVGYEVKVSRADFRCEIRKPSKRAWAVAMTHEFYFCAPKGLIKPHEVPEDCGLLEVHGAGSRVAKPSPITEALPLGHLHLSQMFRHGMRPGWLRMMAERKRRERWKRRAAEMEAASAREERDRAVELLAEHARIEVGSSWVATSKWERYRKVTVSEVTDTSVRCESPTLTFSPRYRIGDFLMEFEPADRAGRMAA